jgi:2-keto-4-pentenoate hydratase/2-oxohepta-3-ene-1,7-dioic acid hydratase in catechol pathway
MKLVTFVVNGTPLIGKVVGDRIVDLTDACTGLCEPSVLGALRAGPGALACLAAAEGGPAHALAAVRLLAPVQQPQKFLAIGLNYRDHVAEIVARGGKAPEQQIWFNKNVSCLNGPYDPIHLPSVSRALDYEGELGVVIGRRCRHVDRAQALDVVAGYLVMNDVTCRDWQRRTPQWTLGKSFDTHGPMGPWLITADEVADPHDLALRVFVNGELRQTLNTGGMVYDIGAQIAELSAVMTLEPGDLIATGTTSGAGFGFNPPKFLQPGDVVRVEVDGLGHIENRVIVAPEGRTS